MRTLLWFTALLAAMGVMIGALDGSLQSIGMTRSDFDAAVRNQTRTQSEQLQLPYLSGNVKRSLRALSPEQQAALVRECLGAAKAIISTPEFAKAHEEFITRNLSAVNHGQDPAKDDMKQMMDNPEAATKNAMSMAGAQMVEGFRKMDAKSLKMLYDMDAAGGDAKLKRIGTLMTSNPEEFKKQYSLWKSASMGGPSTEQEYQAALGKATVQMDRQKISREQQSWEKYNLRAVVTRQLDQFIATAGSVDFNAQTRPQAGKLVFVNPAYERKDGTWKMLYRAGKAPVQAALEVARVWRKEL